MMARGVVCMVYARVYVSTCSRPGAGSTRELSGPGAWVPRMIGACRNGRPAAGGVIVGGRGAGGHEEEE